MMQFIPQSQMQSLSAMNTFQNIQGFQCYSQGMMAPQPMSPVNSKGGARHKFTPEEDARLSELVSLYGARKWELIARSMPERSARQCRDRYSNYLKPGFFNGEWSREEDALLVRKYRELGPRWSQLKEFFRNRSPNAIKNRWNYFVSRQCVSEDGAFVDSSFESESDEISSPSVSSSPVAASPCEGKPEEKSNDLFEVLPDSLFADAAGACEEAPFNFEFSELGGFESCFDFGTEEMSLYSF
ncbi:r2r3-MYB transcription factor [Tritrichomonas foetus]|uniref:R2r3-MYB transcription factor n=1 Tax=Tritrichomonas foetus TaxID=1144522 RepID=A0A1J4JG72_9EUKA|nr:r2r3-MYB transcription factor [Tritrichomonas foetus]|eukprot:OHS98144.1 r2r3-MYB transcription factor [Tritrichomonas foetus]